MNPFLGLLTAIFILPPDSGQRLIRKYLPIFKHGIAAVAKNPWLYDIREELESPESIPYSQLDETVYSIECEIGDERLVFYFHRDHVAVDYATRDMFLSDYPDLLGLLREACSLSEAGVIGYELELFVDEVDKCLSSLIADRSRRPILIKKENLDIGEKIFCFNMLRNVDRPTPEESDLVRCAELVC